MAGNGMQYINFQNANELDSPPPMHGGNAPSETPQSVTMHAAQQPYAVNQAYPQGPYQQNVPLKFLKALRALANTELILAIVVILLDIISIARFQPSFWPFHIGVGIVIGILGVITACLGVAAFRNIYEHRCLLISHFVMCIIIAVLDAMLFGTATASAAVAKEIIDWRGHVLPAEQLTALRAIVALGSLLAITAFAHFICCIMSSAFVCNNLCSTNQSVTIIYMQNQQTPGTQLHVAGNLEPR